MKTSPTQEQAGSLASSKNEDQPTSRPSWLQIASNLFFVLGSVLYLVMAIEDLQWSQTLQDLPMEVRTADDDTVWVNYRLEERYNASLLLQGDESVETEEDLTNEMDNNEDNAANSTRRLQLEQYLASTIASNTNHTEAPVAETTPPTDSVTTVAPVETPPPIATTEAPVETTTDPVPNSNSSVATASPSDASSSDGTTVTPAELYYDEWWADLPADIQTAYATLGYNETVWNEGLGVEVEELNWDQMTLEQQTAASLIGYSQEIWDAGTEAPSVLATIDGSLIDVEEEEEEVPAVTTTTPPAETNPPTTIAPDATDPPGTNPPMEATTSPPTPGTTIATSPPTSTASATTSITPLTYEDYDWAELPPEVQQAATTLGYSERLWNFGGVAETEDFWWRELSLEQQQAAAVLGYGEYSWDGTDNPNPPPLDESLGGNATVGDGATTTNAASSSNRGADDDDYVSYDDDYLFQIGNSDTQVSRYMVLYFSAALCFVYVGLLDLIREKKAFHFLMIFAGINGVISAMLVEKDIFISNIFNALSVHFFLLEAATLFSVHKSHRVGDLPEDLPVKKILEKGMEVGDILFLIGSIVDVFVSMRILLLLLSGCMYWNNRAIQYITISIVNLMPLYFLLVKSYHISGYWTIQPTGIAD